MSWWSCFQMLLLQIQWCPKILPQCLNSIQISEFWTSISSFAPFRQQLLHHPGWWVSLRDTLLLSNPWYNQVDDELGNQMGPEVLHDKGGLPRGIHELKQLKSIAATLQQKYRWNQVKLISATCCSGMGHLAGLLEIKQSLVFLLQSGYTCNLTQGCIWHSK